MDFTRMWTYYHTHHFNSSLPMLITFQTPHLNSPILLITFSLSTPHAHFSLPTSLIHLFIPYVIHTHLSLQVYQTYSPPCTSPLYLMSTCMATITITYSTLSFSHYPIVLHVPNIHLHGHLSLFPYPTI